MTHLSPRVLIVEDEEVAGMLAKKFFQKLSCQVDIVHTGYAALDKLNLRFYDLIIMDLGIFDLDGLNIAKHIINQPNSANKTTPVIAVTAYEQPSVKKRAFTLGFADYFLKPLTMANCQAALDRYVS